MTSHIENNQGIRESQIVTPTTSQFLPHEEHKRIREATPPREVPQHRPSTEGLNKTRKLNISSKTFEKLPDKEKSEKFLNLYEENVRVTSKYNELQEKVKLLTIQLTKLTKDIKQERAGRPLTTDTDKLDKLQNENERLKAKLKDNAKKPQPRHGAPGPFLSKRQDRPKVLSYTAPPAETSEKDNLILRLKEQLQSTEEHLVKLLAKDKPETLVKDFSNEYRQKSEKLHEIETRFLTLEDNYTAQRTYVNYLKEALDDSQTKLRQERTDRAQLDMKLKSAEMSSAGANDLALKVQELYKENKELENRIMELCKSPFIREAGSRLTTSGKLLTATSELEEKILETNNFKEKLLQAEGENFKLTQELNSHREELAKLKEEKIHLTANLQQKSSYVKEFEQQLRGLSGGSVDVFMKALGNLKLQGEEPAWAQLDFIERATEIPEDVPSLKREVERLKTEKGQLAAELEKCKSLLTIKEDIERENLGIVRRENELLQLQLKASRVRADEVARLVPRGQDKGHSVFIEEDTQVGAGENILDLWIGVAEYSELQLLNSIGDVPEVLSFITADFYEHETQSTSVCEGYHPKYSLHISYVVQVSDFFVAFLETNSVVLEARFSTKQGAVLVAKGDIALKQLINVDLKRPESVVFSSECCLRSAGDGKTQVGLVAYKLRMRYPINEQVRQYIENQQISRRLEPPGQQRSLLVTVVSCIGLKGGTEVRPYVWYHLKDQKETVTPCGKGSNPTYDYTAVFQYIYNSSIQEYIDTSQVEFLVFDDRSEKMLGASSIPLANLFQGDIVEGAFSLIAEDGTEGGSISVRILWTDTQVSQALYS